MKHTGTIAHYSDSNGTGLIRPDAGGEEHWFHWTAIRTRDLKTGDKVEYQTYISAFGQLEVENLKVIA